MLERHAEYCCRRILEELKERGVWIGETALRRVLDVWGLGLLCRPQKPESSLTRAELERSCGRPELVRNLTSPKLSETLYPHFTEVRHAWGEEEDVPHSDPGS